jgi:hypothetical protein
MEHRIDWLHVDDTLPTDGQEVVFYDEDEPWSVITGNASYPCHIHTARQDELCFYSSTLSHHRLIEWWVPIDSTSPNHIKRYRGRAKKQEEIEREKIIMKTAERSKVKGENLEPRNDGYNLPKCNDGCKRNNLRYVPPT